MAPGTLSRLFQRYGPEAAFFKSRPVHGVAATALPRMQRKLTIQRPQAEKRAPEETEIRIAQIRVNTPQIIINSYQYNPHARYCSVDIAKAIPCSLIHLIILLSFN